MAERLLVSCVMMREKEKKNDEKGYFFRAGQCAALSSFRIGKMFFFVGIGFFFLFFFLYKSYKMLQK